MSDTGRRSIPNSRTTSSLLKPIGKALGDNLKRPRSASWAGDVDAFHWNNDHVIRKCDQCDIDKSHWKDKRFVKECDKCQRVLLFPFLRRHCRICGDVFCHNCTRFTRRLSIDVRPDPSGKKYQVCEGCSQETEQVEGATRSYTQQFTNFLNDKRQSGTDQIIPDVDDHRWGTESSGLLRHTSVRKKLSDVFHESVCRPKGAKVYKNSMKAVALLNRSKKNTKYEQAACEACASDVNKAGKFCVVCKGIFCSCCCKKDTIVRCIFAVQRDVVDPEILFTTDESLCKGYQYRRYRVCRNCKDDYRREMFLKEIGELTKILLQYQAQINEHINNKVPDLKDDYMFYFYRLKNVQCYSTTQTRLKKNAVNVMYEFYLTTVSKTTN